VYQNEIFNLNQSAYNFFSADTEVCLKKISENPNEQDLRITVTGELDNRKDVCRCSACENEMVNTALLYLPENFHVIFFGNDRKDLALKAVERAIEKVKAEPSKYCIKVSPLACNNTSFEWVS
jgi:hypothetical protein